MSAETDPDGKAVHTPDAGESVTAEGDGATATDGATTTDGASETGEPAADGFGRRGWALTAALFTCVLVIPGIIYVYPYAAGSFGLTFFGTYLVLPLIPAVLLGLIAVWSMTAATADRDGTN